MNQCCIMKYQYVDADANLDSQLDPMGAQNWLHFMINP